LTALRASASVLRTVRDSEAGRVVDGLSMDSGA
jgi:hypothetical protein